MIFGHDGYVKSEEWRVMSDERVTLSDNNFVVPTPMPM